MLVVTKSMKKKNLRYVPDELKMFLFLLNPKLLFIILIILIFIICENIANKPFEALDDGSCVRLIVTVATRFGTFSRTSDFSVFGTAIVFLGAATRGGLKYWYYEVCFLSSFSPFWHCPKNL